MAITEEELKESIRILRERRLAIPALRDYRPQTRSKKPSTKTAKLEASQVDVLDFFGGLIQPSEVDPTTSEAPTEGTGGEEKGGDANGIS